MHTEDDESEDGSIGESNSLAQEVKNTDQLNLESFR